jgi:hypothetical protein
MLDILSLSAGFIITFLSEAAIVFAFTRQGVKPLLLYEFLINLFTWPLANLFSGSSITVILVVECAVVVVESVLIKALFCIGSKKALLVSFAANATSALLGFLLLWRILF